MKKTLMLISCILLFFISTISCFATDPGKINYKDGIVRDGSSIGSGKILGNFKDGIIRDGQSRGSGRILGNIKDGVIRDGQSLGAGKPLLNIKDGIVRDGQTPGAGRTIGKVSQFTVKGIEREHDATIVAVYHFFVKKLR